MPRDPACTYLSPPQSKIYCLKDPLPDGLPNPFPTRPFFPKTFFPPLTTNLFSFFLFFILERITLLKGFLPWSTHLIMKTLRSPFLPPPHSKPFSPFLWVFCFSTWLGVALLFEPVLSLFPPFSSPLYRLNVLGLLRCSLGTCTVVNGRLLLVIFFFGPPFFFIPSLFPKGQSSVTELDGPSPFRAPDFLLFWFSCQLIAP